MLRRRLTLLQAVSLNMAMMVGIGPFITIPPLLGYLPGPHALVAWVLGAVVAWADGLVWSELAAAFPGSGGTYHFFDAVYGRGVAGRMLKFLFVWQFLFSGPLELASGAIGLAHHVGYFWGTLRLPLASAVVRLPALAPRTLTLEGSQVLAAGLMVAVIAMAYRRIEVAGRLMVALWIGMLATVLWVIVAGLAHFDARQAFTVPPGAWKPGAAPGVNLGRALGLAMYSYFGYYQVCYLGDEVTEPARTLPRAILLSVAAVGLVYSTMNAAIFGVLPWREVRASDHVASDMMLRLHGAWAARGITLMILWTGLASTFAGLLSYSRVPYAAAEAGQFFRALARTHPRGEFPHRSLLLVGILSALACLVDLEAVILGLLTSRIVVQFLGQIATVFYLRGRPELRARLRYRMALFPLPALVALAGWLWIFGTSPGWAIAYGAASLGLGIVVFPLWDRASRRGGRSPEGEGQGDAPEGPAP